MAASQRPRSSPILLLALAWASWSGTTRGAPAASRPSPRSAVSAEAATAAEAAAAESSAPSAGTTAPEGAASPTSTARAGGFPSHWLDWSPPPECPEQAYIEDRIRGWLGSDLPTSADLKVETRLTWKGNGAWEVEVAARLNGREGHRHITVQRCSDAADFVALTVVLAVNPGFVPSSPDSDPTPSPSGSAPPSPFGDPEDSVEADEPPDAPPALPPDDPPTPLDLLLEAGGELLLGALPSPRGAVVVGAGLTWPHLRFQLDGSYSPEASEPVPTATGPIAFSLVTARLAGCYLVGPGKLRLGPCASIELGAMQAGQQSGHVDLPQTSELWAQLGFGATGEAVLLPWLAPFIALDVTTPLIRPRFVLDDGTLVHQPSAVGLRGTAGVRFFFSLR